MNFIFFFLLVAISIQAGINHINQQPLDNAAKLSNILTSFATYNSIDTFKEHLESNKPVEIRNKYAVQCQMENKKKRSLCALCHSNWKEYPRDFIKHMRKHFYFFEVVNRLNDKCAPIQKSTQTFIEQNAWNDSSKSIEATQDVAVATQSSAYGFKDFTDVNQLNVDPDTCIVCFQNVLPIGNDDEHTRSPDNLASHIERHQHIEQRSDRVCIANAEVYQKHFPNIALVEAVKKEKQFYEEARKIYSKHAVTELGRKEEI